VTNLGAVRAVQEAGAWAAPASGTSAAGLRVVPPAEWDDLVARLGGLDTYTRSAYHSVSAALEPPGTVPILLHHVSSEGEVALPLLLRPLPGADGWDASSAYGYGGPVGSGRGAAAFGAALDAWALENGVVATFLRLHPLLDNASAIPPSAERVTLGATVAWDTAPGRDLLAAMHPHHRRAVRRARRAGVDVAVIPEPDHLGGFRRLYETTMRRQRAAPSYFFPDAYWDALAAERRSLGLVTVEARIGGELVAALLCLSGGPWLHYHLGASADAARTVGASNLCFLAAAQWGQSRGLTRFHLGGGVGGASDSSLFVFKHRYDPGSPPLPFSIAKLVHDRDRFRQLAGTTSTEGFFPPGRRGR
jgi:serine/alanine adding enzyme